jgi:GGDEF domain-containing protein
VSALVAGAVLVVALVRSRREARRRAERRVEALGALAHSMERLAGELDAVASRPRLARPGPDRPPHAPASLDPATGLPARAALVDALVTGVERARAEGTRLGLAVVAVSESGPLVDESVARVVDAARVAAPGVPAFRSGERSIALVLQGAGRADAIATVARLEASLGRTSTLSTSVVELAPDEDAVGLLARASRAG